MHQIDAIQPLLDALGYGLWMACVLLEPTLSGRRTWLKWFGEEVHEENARMCQDTSMQAWTERLVKEDVIGPIVEAMRALIPSKLPIVARAAALGARRGVPGRIVTDDDQIRR